METSIAKLNLTNQETLRQFRKNLFDVLTPVYTDAVLMKWLRAGNFNLRKCELLFRENLWCRDLYEIDYFAYKGKKPEVAEKYEFLSPMGYAKDGTPITYVAMGRGDYLGFGLSMSSYEICLYCSLCFEQDLRRAREHGKKIGKELNEVTYVVDMECFQVKNALHTTVIETALDLFRMMQDQYPEVWKHLLIVNAAFYFYQAFNVFRPIFRDTLLQNVRVVSKEDTPELLLKYIDADVLPVFLGGTKVDSKGDPMCSEFLKFGGTVPEEYFSRNWPLLDPADPDTESVWIRPRSCYNHSLIVREANSRLTIELRSEGGSIATSVLYRAFGPDPKRVDVPPANEYLNPHDVKSNVCGISPCVKLQTHLSPVNETCKAPKPGIYIFKFDNTCTWMTSRRVIFRIRVFPPHS